MKGFFRKSAGLLAILIMLAGSLVSGGCNLLPAEEEELAPPLMQPAKIEYKTEPAAKGTLIMQLRMSGSLYPEIQKNLSFEKQGGRLKALHVKTGQLVKAGDLIAELDSASLASQVKIQELEVEKCQLTLTQLRASKADKYSISRSKIDLQQQEIRLADMQAELAATQIVAPIDGKVIYIISLPAGEYINAYQMVAKVADTSEMVMITTADDAAKLPIGAEVVLEFGKKEYTGEVVANPSSLFSDPDEQMRKAAIIRIKGEWPADAALGDSARIIFVQEKRENVLILPRTEINLMAGRRYVNVLEDGVRVEKDVEIGLMTDTEAEIIKGLEEGDQVIIN